MLRDFAASRDTGFLALAKARSAGFSIHHLHGNNMTRRLSILDLFAIALVVAVHLFHFPLAVWYGESSLIHLIWLIPTLITVWIHIRARPTVAQAICLHYVVSIYWAFLYGYGYALAANAMLLDFTPCEPARVAVGATKQMAFVAIFSSLLYGAAAYCVLRTVHALRLASKDGV